MQRSVEAATVVGVSVGRARAILLSDPRGMVRAPDASAIQCTVELEVGSPAEDGGLPLLVRSRGRGSLRELVADLTIVPDETGARVELRGMYRWDGGGDGYGAGVLAHRVARWLAHDLVRGVGERLVERADGERPAGS